MRIIVFCLAALLGIGLSGARAADLANDEQKALYALGVAISQSLNDFALSESELEIVKSGLSDGILKRTLKVDRRCIRGQGGGGARRQEDGVGRHCDDAQGRQGTLPQGR